MTQRFTEHGRDGKGQGRLAESIEELCRKFPGHTWDKKAMEANAKTPAPPAPPPTATPQSKIDANSTPQAAVNAAECRKVATSANAQTPAAAGVTNSAAQPPAAQPAGGGDENRRQTASKPPVPAAAGAQATVNAAGCRKVATSANAQQPAKAGVTNSAAQAPAASQAGGGDENRRQTASKPPVPAAAGAQAASSIPPAAGDAGRVAAECRKVATLVNAQPPVPSGVTNSAARPPAGPRAGGGGPAPSRTPAPADEAALHPDWADGSDPDWAPNWLVAQEKAEPSGMPKVMSGRMCDTRGATRAALRKLCIELRKCELVFRRHWTVTLEYGRKLLQVRELRTHLGRNRPTFEEYCEEDLGIHRSVAYRRMHYAEAMDILAEACLDTCQYIYAASQVRPLTMLRNADGTLNKQLIPSVYRAAVQAAEDARGDAIWKDLHLTARMVRSAVNKVLRKARQPKPKPQIDYSEAKVIASTRTPCRSITVRIPLTAPESIAEILIKHGGPEFAKRIMRTLDDLMPVYRGDPYEDYDMG